MAAAPDSPSAPPPPARQRTVSLSLTLSLTIVGVIVLGFGAYAVVSLRATEDYSRRAVLENAEQISDLIERSTHYGMLLNRKEDVHQIIRTVAQQQGVEGVRIYDKNGTIIYSALEPEIGRRVDMQAEACVICHDHREPLHSVPATSRARTYHAVHGRVLGLINPIENKPECSNAACHAHPSSQTILGVLDVKMSLNLADERLQAAQEQVLLAAVAVSLVAGLVAAILVAWLVRRPVKALIAGTARVAAGDLDTEIQLDRADEMGLLARSFNAMGRDLRQARAELTSWSKRLETRLLEKTEELGRTQRQVVHMEKMASLGKLAAAVAHELNNPLAGIVNYARLVQRELDDPGHDTPTCQDIRSHAQAIQREALRSGDIVRNLLLFARRSAPRLQTVSLAVPVDNALKLIQHHSRMAEVHIARELESCDDTLLCDADQIQQALVALLVNAVEAMPRGGQLTVRSRCLDREVVLEVEDSGVGIPADVLPHIFEPFYSTKDELQGVGLGLAVVYGIVQRHQGTIEVDSRVGQGTRFTLVLPRTPDVGVGDPAHLIEGKPAPGLDDGPAEEPPAHR